MLVTDAEIEAVQGHFPNLYMNSDRSKILGEISFTAYYDGKQLHLNPSKKDEKDIYSGYYEIEICLRNINSYGLPKVFEIGGKIDRSAQALNLHIMDLHLNDYDNSCCLGIFNRHEADNMKLYTFIVEMVFSFFAWQAYFFTFKRKPPWGEYSHGHRGILEKKYEDFQDMKCTGRNDLCPCGSGLKFKKCCIDKYSNIKRSIK